MATHRYGKHDGPNEYAGRDFFNAHDQTDITITTRDRMMIGWETTMELARNFHRWSIIEEGTPAGDMFKEIAEYQGISAAKLHDMLKSHEPHRTS